MGVVSQNFISMYRLQRIDVYETSSPSFLEGPQRGIYGFPPMRIYMTADGWDAGGKEEACAWWKSTVFKFHTYLENTVFFAP